MRKFIRLILRLLESVHIDIYGLAVRWLSLWKWAAAYPKEGELESDGVCLAVDIEYVTSLSQVGRDFADMMRQAKIPFQLFNTHLPLPCPAFLPKEESQAYLEISEKKIRYKTVICFSTLPVATDKRYFNVLTPFWEFESGMPEGRPGLFNGINHVVVFSDFCYNYIKKILPAEVGISKIRYPFPRLWKTTKTKDETRSRFCIPHDKFVVFFHFSFGSGYERKNPEGALQAFLTAFDGKDDVHLVLKTAGFNSNPQGAERLNCAIEKSGFKESVTLIDQYLTHDEILELIESSDVYMSLHRGEGFGIGMLEAMAVGTPVVCTNYGGNTEFCRPDTAFLVGYRVVPVVTSEHVYDSVGLWPEPNVDEAAILLRTIYENRLLGLQKAKKAKEFIDEYFNEKNFSDDVRLFLARVQR